MLKLIIGPDWVFNRATILSAISDDVKNARTNRVLLVPELISHDMERKLCQSAGVTASRFAEVLSFTRLARRVADDAGHSAVPCLDEGGRVVAMASAVSQVQSKLKFFAAVGTKPEFITGLVETVDECKRCAVDPAALTHASKETTGTLAQKLEELSLIYEAYDGICARGKKDPRDQLTWLYEELESGNYAESHVFYIDGFADFTRQQLDILKYLISSGTDVTISLCCDAAGTSSLAFERPGETASTLLRIAKEQGIAVQLIQNAADPGMINRIAMSLFEGELPANNDGALTVACCESVYQECEVLAERILDLIKAGARYRDISVVCPNFAEYEGPLGMIFQRCEIPAYLSGTQSILERPVIGTVIAALEAALNGFVRKDMLTYLKTALSPLTLQECDLIENYALLWNISGKKWLQNWKMHPRGLVNEWSEADHVLLNKLNNLREKVMYPLEKLQNALKGSENTGEMVCSLYEFLEQIQLANQLSALSDKLEDAGDFQNAQILNQLWEILVNALEQLHDVLGKSIWDGEAFIRLFRILLSRYDVGTIPSVLDAVTIGDIASMRCNETMHLFVLGAVEGSLPGYGSASGVLTDQDRVILRNVGVPLNGGSVDSLQTSFSEIYGVFSGAKATVYISYPGGQPSYVYQRLRSICGNELVAQDVLGAVVCNEKHTAAYLLQRNDRNAAEELGIAAQYDLLNEKRSYQTGWVTKENIEKLYGKQFRLSASQIDLYSNCAMSYFLKYGLRAKERKPADVDPAEFGTFVHDVLERTARQIVNQGGFKVVSKDETIQIAANYAKEYIQTHFAELDSQRISYLLARNGKELAIIVEELWNELHDSGFEPAMFELSFGGNETGYPPIRIQGETADALVRGFVDRVDVWKSDVGNYFRVVDYKTGIKTFDYCDIINGIGLQMLLYLFALAQADSEVLGNDPVAAGVQYFPARVPVVTVENAVDEAEVSKEREKCWKRTGLVLNEDHVLSAMESPELPSRMPFKRKKDGTVTGDVADRQQFLLLRKFIFRYLQTMVDDIASGNVTANPYTRDARKNACRFCPYGAICHKMDVDGRRVFKAISSQQFWDDLSKEVNRHG